MRKLSVTVLAGLVIVSCAALAGDWPQFLGPNRDGVSPETGLARTWPEGGPKELWKLDMGPGFGPAAIVAGKVYIMDHKGDQDLLRCLDLAKGTEEWSYSYDAPGKVSGGYPGPRSTPAVDDKYIFTIGVFGHVKCFAREGKKGDDGKVTHEPLWSKNLTDEEFGSKLPQWAFSQSPLVYKDMVIIAPQSKNVGVAALDKATGAVKWKSGPTGAGVITYCSPMLAKIGGKDQIVMESGDRDKGVRVNGIDPADGKILWTYSGWKCDIPVPSPTAIGDGRFFVTGGYRSGCAMFKVEAKTDGTFDVKELWKNADAGSHANNPILWKDHLYFASNQNKASGLVCLDLEGNIKWQTKNAPAIDKGGMVMADGLLYLEDGSGGFLRLIDANPEAYKELAKAKVLAGSEIWGPLSLSDGKLVLRDQKQVKCLDVSAGK
ncbi:MAG: PQQ-binding-like beta-propeller repeat protein [Phycisphaerae bacterium]